MYLRDRVLILQIDASVSVTRTGPGMDEWKQLECEAEVGSSRFHLANSSLFP